MMTLTMRIGLVDLRESSHWQVFDEGDEWRAIKLTHPNSVSQFLAGIGKLPAVAIVGSNNSKSVYAAKALTLGKHVLTDFPAGVDPAEIFDLREQAASEELCFYSPNLLKLYPGINELRELTKGAANLLSLTTVYSVSGKGKHECLVNLARILDLIEWMVGSECVNVGYEKSSVNDSVNARVIVLSHRNGTKTFLNLCQGQAIKQKFSLDAIFDNAFIRLNTGAQNVRIESLGKRPDQEIDWAISPLSKAINEFVALIKKHESKQDSDNARHVLDLAKSIG